MDNRRDWIGNLLTRPSQPSGNFWRHKNAIWSVGHKLTHPCDPSAKVICPQVFGFVFTKADASIYHQGYVAYGQQIVESFSWRHLAMAGPCTFTMINARQIRGLQESSRFLNWCFLVFFFAKCHRVLGTRQSDVRVINRGSLSQAELSTFPFDGIYSLNSFSWNARQRRASGKHWCPQILPVRIYNIW